MKTKIFLWIMSVMALALSHTALASKSMDFPDYTKIEANLYCIVDSEDFDGGIAVYIPDNSRGAKAEPRIWQTSKDPEVPGYGIELEVLSFKWICPEEAECGVTDKHSFQFEARLGLGQRLGAIELIGESDHQTLELIRVISGLVMKEPTMICETRH